MSECISVSLAGSDELIVIGQPVETVTIESQSTIATGQIDVEVIATDNCDTGLTEIHILDSVITESSVVEAAAVKVQDTVAVYATDVEVVEVSCTSVAQPEAVSGIFIIQKNVTIPAGETLVIDAVVAEEVSSVDWQLTLTTTAKRYRYYTNATHLDGVAYFTEFAHVGLYIDTDMNVQVVGGDVQLSITNNEAESVTVSVTREITVDPVGVPDTGSNIIEDAKDYLAFEDLSGGDYINIFASGARKAKATDVSYAARGFVKTAVLAGQTATVYFEGVNNQVSGLTDGEAVFLADTPGKVVHAVGVTTTGILQYLGDAASDTSINTEINPPELL